ncbi:MAG: DNA repair protein RecN [Synechococcus sp.]|nr:DNA repair protein RecN [Synechococcus sp.]
MLAGLRLHNIALIDSLELDFEPGFTVLTGETGAGKSLLLDALDAVLGGMQGTSATRLVRSGQSRAAIEARFVPCSSVYTWLQQQELCAQADDSEGHDDELLVSREWRRQEDRLSSRFRINGVAVNRQQVLALRPLLIDLTVQGQTQQLARPGQQRRWLDRLGAASLEASLEVVRHHWQVWREAFTRLQQARDQADQFEAQHEERKALLEELEAAALDDPDELNQLTTEQDRLVHGVRLQEGLAQLIGRLQDGADQAPSAMDHLLACCHELQQMHQLDASLQSMNERCLDLEAGLRDLIRDLEHYGVSLDSDPARLHELQERLALIKRLERRHGVDLLGLCQLRDELREQLGEGGGDVALAQLEETEQVARQFRDQANHQLSQLREQAAQALERTLLDHLRPMGLANVRFEVAISSCEPSEHGADAVQFLFSANPGQPLAPLSEVASGGEMSRFLLALKTSLSAVDGSSSLLFDEIDSGVSGRVSGAMAELLCSMARHRQVFCVTHQPLVAAAADHHFRVSKTVVEGQTRSQVSQLRDTQAREQELAELAGGDLNEARAYAASLLDQRAA